MKKRKYTRKKVEFYSVATECECGCGGMVMNPDDHYRNRKFLPRHANTNGTHPRIGMKEPDENVEKRLDSLLITLKKKGPTCLERDLYYFLDRNGIEYEKQVRIKRTIADAFVKSHNLIIFADGLYWHTKPEVASRDIVHNKILRDNGYSVIRLSSINYGKNLNFEPLTDFIAEYNANK